MNAHQTRLLLLAAVNVALVLLFPPFNSVTWGHADGTLDAFYFVLARPSNTYVNGGLLALELAWIALNGALGWALLRPPDSGPALMSARSGVLTAAAVNLVIMLLMPPYENYESVLRISGTYFDGFYLVFGDKWQRHFYIPLLYMEVLWLLVNTATLWLLFRPAERKGEDSADSFIPVPPARDGQPSPPSADRA